jgi:hypothetical protein
MIFDRDSVKAEGGGCRGRFVCIRRFIVPRVRLWMGGGPRYFMEVLGFRWDGLVAGRFRGTAFRP